LEITQSISFIIDFSKNGRKCNKRKACLGCLRDLLQKIEGLTLFSKEIFISLFIDILQFLISYMRFFGLGREN
jgi:hypothetical protein